MAPRITVYLDCEFTDLVAIDHDIKLISAGFVAEDGRELYFELPGNWGREECSAFVHEAVLPHLDPGRHGLSTHDAAAGLKEWIEGFGMPVQLATDAPGYDFPLVAELLREHGCWPRNLLGTPRNVNTGNVQQEYERYFEYQPMAIRHHALWDARALAYAAGIEDRYWRGKG